MTEPNWATELQVIGDLPLGEAAAKLREIGEGEAARALVKAARKAPAPPPQLDATTPGSLPPSRLRVGRDRGWLNTAHAVGHIAPQMNDTSDLIPIRSAASISADDSLNGVRINVTLETLRLAAYPGREPHCVLLQFAARSQTDQGPEQLQFFVVTWAREGEQDSFLRRPIFVGAKVGGDGLFLQCATVNVQNESDEELLRFVDDRALKSGLDVAASAQPIVASFSALMMTLTERIARHNRNTAVQLVNLGLDFSRIASRPKLAEGSYIITQIPEAATWNWNWKDWSYEPARGRLVNHQQPNLSTPYNYIVVGVSRYREK